MLTETESCVFVLSAVTTVEAEVYPVAVPVIVAVSDVDELNVTVQEPVEFVVHDNADNDPEAAPSVITTPEVLSEVEAVIIEFCVVVIVDGLAESVRNGVGGDVGVTAFNASILP